MCRINLYLYYAQKYLFCCLGMAWNQLLLLFVYVVWTEHVDLDEKINAIVIEKRIWANFRIQSCHLNISDKERRFFADKTHTLVLFFYCFPVITWVELWIRLAFTPEEYHHYTSAWQHYCYRWATTTSLYLSAWRLSLVCQNRRHKVGILWRPSQDVERAKNIRADKYKSNY